MELEISKENYVERLRLSLWKMAELKEEEKTKKPLCLVDPSYPAIKYCLQGKICELLDHVSLPMSCTKREREVTASSSRTVKLPLRRQ